MGATGVETDGKDEGPPRNRGSASSSSSGRSRLEWSLSCWLPVSCWLLLGLDPQLDVVRLRLAAFGLVLRDITIKPCPTLDVPGASLEELPGTVIDQHPPGGEKVAASSAVDVTVCMPD
jgi:hypothetical protein